MRSEAVFFWFLAACVILYGIYIVLATDFTSLRETSGEAFWLALLNVFVIMSLGLTQIAVGWLTLFGARCRDRNKCTEGMVDEVMVEGGKLARAEALKLVTRSKRYGVVLNFLAKVGTANWTQIKATLEAKEHRLLPNPTVAGTLNTLIKTSLISKTDGHYSIIDPLLASGVQQDPLPE